MRLNKVSRWGSLSYEIVPLLCSETAIGQWIKDERRNVTQGPNNQKTGKAPTSALAGSAGGIWKEMDMGPQNLQMASEQVRRRRPMPAPRRRARMLCPRESGFSACGVLCFLPLVHWGKSKTTPPRVSIAARVLTTCNWLPKLFKNLK